MTRRHLSRLQPGQLAEWFSQIGADYDAAKQSRYRRKRMGIPSMGASGDYHYNSESEFLRMLEYARDYDRNDPIVGQGITRLLDNVIQDGFKLDPQTGDSALNRDLADLWDEWTRDADRCDLAGEHTFHEMEKLVPRQMLVDGDVFVLPLRDGRLEIVEAHRCRTPRTKKNVVHGVLLDANRKRLEYWFTRDEIQPSRVVTRVGDMRQYPARDGDGHRAVLHIYDPRRFSQTRGVSAFTPIANTIGMNDDVLFAKLVQQQIVSCFAILRERSADADAYGEMSTGEQTTESLGDGTTRTIEGIAPGMEVAGNPGETLKGFSPQVPNPEFFQHAMLVLTIISINVGVPVAVLMLDPSQTNFSGWRGAIDQARFGFRRLQRKMKGRFHSPVYLWKLRQWIAEDLPLRAQVGRSDVNIFKHFWHAPVWPYIEPLKDATADLLRVRNGLISPRRMQAERGRDWDEVSTETIEDNALAIEKAKTKAAELNARFPEDEPVHWRELLSLPSPEGVSVSVSGGGGSGEGSL